MSELDAEHLVDYSVWLKLLFIPTIGCLILAAFAAEIHFNRKQSAKQSINHTHKSTLNALQHPLLTPTVTNTNKKSHETFTQTFNDRIKQLINQSANHSSNQFQHPKSSAVEPPVLPTIPNVSLKLNIVNSDGVSHPFNIDSNEPLQTIITAYLNQSNSQSSGQSDKLLDEEVKQPSDDKQHISSNTTQTKPSPNSNTKDVVTSSTSTNNTKSTSNSFSVSTSQFITQLAPYFSPAMHQTIRQSIGQSSNQSVVLRLQGRRLPLDRSPAELGLTDQSVLNIEPDFLALFTLIRRQINQTINQLNREYLIEKNAKEQAEQSIAQFHIRLQLQAQHTTELKLKTDALSYSIKDLESQIVSIQSQIDTTNSSITQLIESMNSLDHGPDDLLLTRQALEVQEKQLSVDLATRTQGIDALKATQSIKINERNAIKQKWRDSLREIETQEKELQVLKTKASRINQSKDKIERIEKQIADQSTYQAKIEANQVEMKQLEEEISTIQSKQSIKQSKEKELQNLKHRLKVLERETKDGQKWKLSAKQLETQVQEVDRLKSSLKQGKAREKALELQMKELHHWRQRARAFEREVKELRGWKRARVEYARLRGELDWIPEFPVEDALDSSGGSDYGSMTNSDSLYPTTDSLYQGVNQATAFNSVDDQAAFFDSIRLSNNASSVPPNRMAEFDFGDDQADLLQYGLDPSLHPPAHNYDAMNSSVNTLNPSLLYSNFPDHDEPFDLQALLNRIDPSMNQPIHQPVTDSLNPTITSPLRQSTNHSVTQPLSSLNLSLKPSMHHLTQSNSQPINQMLSQPINQLNTSLHQPLGQSMFHQSVHPHQSPINQSQSNPLSQTSTHNSDDENELLTAGRSDRSIKQSISQSILSSKWPYESLNQQLSPIHQAMNAAISPRSLNAFRWSNQSNTSPLLIIDDRVRANSTDSSNWSRLYGNRDPMSQSMNDLPPGLARFNSPLVIIDDAPDRQKQPR